MAKVLRNAQGESDREVVDGQRPRPRGGPAPAAPIAASALALQATAGNRATTLWLQRQGPGQAGGGVGQAGPAGDTGAEEQATGKVYGEGDTFDGRLKTTLSERDVLYHTLNNVSDKERFVTLKIQNAGEALLSLDTQYEREGSEPDRWWGALYVQSGKSGEVRNGLPAHTSLRLKLYGEKDHTKPDATRVEGTVSVRPA